jgi:uncharacterized protein (DUF305 family)
MPVRADRHAAFTTVSPSTLALIAALVVAGCGAAVPIDQRPPIVQPGAPGGSGRAVTPSEASTLRQPHFTQADVVFMQGMIGHHRQAVEMVDLLKTRTENDDMRKLGLRIEVSQADEIRMMQRWLQDRGQDVPAEHAMHMHGATLMPGMLTAEEMARLTDAKGPAFDRLFLEGMIKHHGGALQMVKDLFATAGAGQESDIFTFASDVDADQRMEIVRMSAMLKELQK